MYVIRPQPFNPHSHPVVSAGVDSVVVSELAIVVGVLARLVDKSSPARRSLVPTYIEEKNISICTPSDHHLPAPSILCIAHSDIYIYIYIYIYTHPLDRRGQCCRIKTCGSHWWYLLFQSVNQVAHDDRLVAPILKKY